MARRKGIPPLKLADAEADFPVLGSVMGQSDATDPMADLVIDLPKLMESRLLITASSGGGKSWAIRRILEQTANLVPHLVIDPEGEFSNLAELYPYVVCGVTSGDVRLDIGTAGVLAEKLMTQNVSAILDISEFDPDERSEFVAGFLGGMMQLPSEYWHHVLVVIDEAHLFCPQHDKSVAKKQVIDLSGRGRKRGLSAVLATQRLSKLNKSAAAELHNRMIGLTILDVDVKRSADELGVCVAEANKVLSDLSPGEFMVYGPALSKRIVKTKVGPVKTSHGFLSAGIKPPASVTDEVKKALTDAVVTARAFNEESSAGDMDVWRLVEARRRLVIISPLVGAASAAPELIERVSAETGVNQSTLLHWLSSFQNGGRTLESLTPPSYGAEDLQAIAKTKVEDGENDASTAIAEFRLSVIGPLLLNPAERAEVVQRLAGEHGVCRATIYRWLNLYRSSGGNSMALRPVRRGRRVGAPQLPRKTIRQAQNAGAVTR